MTLIGILIFMILAVVLGRRSPKVGYKQYLIIILITLAQVGIAVYQMFTMPMPPFN